MNKLHLIILGIFLSGCLKINSAAALDNSTQRHAGAQIFSEYQFCKRKLRGDILLRTELFFGLSRSKGPDITEAEFQNFIDNKVTPRFPDGLTVLDGKGQFRDSAGAIISEGSKLLILLYPFSAVRNEAVEQIRADYKTAFQQESVLRVDEPTCVSF